MKSRIINLLVLAAAISMFIAGCAQQIKAPSEEFQEFIDTGILAVESAPSGAQVYADGELKGLTPLTLYNFPAGTHIIAVKNEGYLDFEKEVNVKTGLTEEIDVELAPLKSEVKIEDFPEPDTPVSTTSLLCGMSTEMFFRLCTLAPLTETHFSFSFSILSCIAGAKVRP